MMLQSPALAGLRGIRHAFFTREGGVSQGIYASLNGGIGSNDHPDHVRENRARMAKALHVAPDKLLTLYQVHSADAVIVDEAIAASPWTPQERPRADALVTNVPGIALGATAADCGPILFADESAGVIGAAHAGWKGAQGGILESTITAMEKLGARYENIVAALGPMISQRNYEVGAEFVASFTALAAANARFFVPSSRADHAMFDLPGFIRARLSAAGITTIDDLALCTYADEARFFSYRRTTHRHEPDYGRHVHAIMLAE